MGACGRSLSIELDALQLHAYELRPGLESTLHEHGYESWALGISGRIEIASPSRSLDVSRGEIAWRPADHRHRERVGAETAVCLLLCPGRALRERLGSGVRQRPLEPIGTPELCFLSWRLARHVRDPEPSPLARVALEGASLSALALWAGAEPLPARDAPAWLHRVREALDDEPAGAWSLAELARLAGVTPEHLSRRFRASFGHTIAEHLRRRRVECAQRFLRETRWSITVIAHQTGFADHSHLTRVFRRQTGLTPSAYRAL